MRSIPDISDQLNQLDEAITSEFIPAITGGIHCSNIKRKLLSLPSKLGGLGIPIFAEISNQEYEYSFFDVIKRSFDENNETRNSTVI